MSALSIRHMNFTLHEMELIEWQKSAEAFKSAPRREWFDWLITRPAKRGNKRVTVTILHGFTKSEFAYWWAKFAQSGYKARVVFNAQKWSRMADEKAMAEQVKLAQEIAADVTLNWDAALMVLDMCEGTEASPIISGGEILELAPINSMSDIPF